MKILKTSEISVCELSYGRWRRSTKGPAEHKRARRISVDELYKNGDGEGVQGNEEENANTGCGMATGWAITSDVWLRVERLVFTPYPVVTRASKHYCTPTSKKLCH